MLINKLKTFLLLAILSLIFIALGSLIGGMAGLQIAFIMSLIMNGIMYFWSANIVLSMYGAKSLDKQQYAAIHDMVAELAYRMNVPMPKLWLIETSMANAFATGRNPEHASIAVTTGILRILQPHELRGVLAHELGHVKNRDILVSTIAATFAAAISYIAHMLQYVAFWGSNDDRKKQNPIILLIVAIVTPIAATLVQLAISRSREYLADETGAHYSGDPLALADALEKLHACSAHTQHQTVEPATASLFIVNPLRDGETLLSLFSTHPPMHKRVARLRQMCVTMVMER